jgi:asparagine synthase (glutamine-hydrolysing)
VTGPTPEVRRAPALRPLDIAYGIPLGNAPVAPLGRYPGGRTPNQAIDAVLIEALGRTPCLLSFSGGRDSSALLAAAVQVARREGLDLPIPATLVFPTSDDSNEDEWQALVLRHLGVTEWERFEIHQEFDAVGPVATTALLRHGLLWPFNTHFHVPIIERAAGGSVVTGFGGDELGNSLNAGRAARILAARRIQDWRDLLVVGLALSPRPVRAAVHRRRARVDLGEVPWLTDEGARQLVHAYGDSEGAVPIGWEATIRGWIWPGRYFRICVESFDVLGSDHDVAVVHPFVEPRVLDALATTGGFEGLGDRTGLMRHVFGDLLPAELIERRTKAGFTDPLWTETARTFAREWSGEGVDRTLVDADALRTHWMGETRNLVSTSLLQAAWLHDHGGSPRPVAG